MKKLIYLFMSLMLLQVEGYACEYRPPGIGVPSCPCVDFLHDSVNSAQEAAFAKCGETDAECDYSSPINCSPITDDEGNTLYAVAACGCPIENPSQEYCWQTDSYPYIGGCCGRGHCHYVKPPEEECCKQEEGTCCPPGVPKCANDKVGNPISVLTGNKVETETDIQFSTPHEKGFKFYRVYRSRSDIDASMGAGWTHSYSTTLTSVFIGNSNLLRIVDESNRKHYFQDIEGLGIYMSIGSTSSYILEESGGNYTWQRGNGVKYTFNQELQYIAKEDNNGNVQTLTYDVEGRLETVTDEATGRTISFTYNAEGRIDDIVGPITTAVSDGIWVSYQYDAEGNLSHVIYADDGNGSTASGFEYKYEDPNDVHNLTEKRNLAGEFLSSWAYDSEDRAYENVTRDGKGVTISGYGTSSVIVTDAQGVEKTYVIETIGGRDTITNVSSPGGCGSCGDDAVRYGYDDQRRVNEIEYANGRIDQYADFDASDRYHTEIRAAGTAEEHTFRYTYHPATGDRLTITESSILGSGDKETIFDYDDDGNTAPNENPTRRMHRRIERGFTFDAAGAATPYEQITVYTYTAKGQVASIDGPLPGDQDKITYTYDPLTGDKLTETRPLVGTTTYAYDAAGNVVTITDVNHQTTTITYDGRNRQLSTTRNGVTTGRTYTAAGEPDTATDALDRTMDYTYNAAGFMEKIIDPSGNFIYYGYNALGRREEQSIFAADATQTHFSGTDYGDPAANPDLPSGKPWKTIRRNADDTADLETTYAYDNAGNLQSVTDAKGNVTSYHYDLFDHLHQVIQPGDAATTYTYDPHGNLESVTDAEGNATLYTYDDQGRLVGTDSPDTGITRYSYDEAGNLRFKVQNSNAIEYRYDGLSRLTHILYSDAAQNVTMTYDTGIGAVGRLAAVADPSGDVQYSYDADGNIEMETRTVNGVTFVTGYGYDAAGNLRTITYPTGHTIDYTPDAADPALISGVLLDGSQPLAAAITYAPFGPVRTITLGNGLQTINTYDKNYQLLTTAAGTVLDRAYTPDAVGNIQGITDNLDPARSQSFAYDDHYRLTSAGGIYGSIDFTYDKVGNRLSRTQTGASPSQNSYHYYPDTNRLQTVVGTHAELIEYDADGNTTTRTPAAGNPMPPITDPADYTYNSSGQRSLKDATGDKIFHYDLVGQLIAETDGLGHLIKAYVWLHGRPLAQIGAGGEVYYYHNDHLGTPQKMTDGSGAVVWAADYLPFGQADVIVGAVENNLRFKGQYYDSETGLHYNYHRYYDPKLGRYLRADPIGILENKRLFNQLKGGINKCGSTSTLSSNKDLNHLYSYVKNNPIKYNDPEGLALKCPDGQHLVRDMAGFGQCMATGPAIVFCPVCVAAAYYAPTGYGIPVGIAACIICLAEEIRCIDENSWCECD